MKKKSLKTLRKKADKVFSLWVRQNRAVNGLCKCYTCIAIKKWGQMHTGHFLSRKFLSVRFSEDNVRPQCPLCNIFKNGEQYVFGKNLEASGVSVTKLQKESKKKVKNPRELYEWVIKEYTERLKNL